MAFFIYYLSTFNVDNIIFAQQQRI